MVTALIATAFVDDVLSSVSASLVILSSCFNASDGTATQRTTPISTRSSEASVRQAGCCAHPRVIKIQAQYVYVLVVEIAK